MEVVAVAPAGWLAYGFFVEVSFPGKLTQAMCPTSISRLLHRELRTWFQVRNWVIVIEYLVAISWQVSSLVTLCVWQLPITHSEPSVGKSAHPL